MDYLEICQKTRQRAGMAGAGPSSVSGQSGEMARVVDWVRQAWLDMQATRTDWQPLWRELEVTVPAGDTIVSMPPALSHLLGERLSVDGRSLSFFQWRDMPRQTVEAMAPVAATMRPDGRLQVYPASPNDVVIRGEYYERPQVLVSDSDEPWLPEHLQDGIIHQAIVYYGIYEDAPELYQTAQAKAQQYLQRMCNEMLPASELGGPLA